MGKKKDKYIEHDGKQYYFFLDGTAINIKTTAGDIIDI
jgi:hypothetical protein